jgi:hypothetical protein
MFYLVEVLKVFKEHVVLSLVSCLSLVAIIMSLHFSGDIRNQLNKQNEVIKNPYFNAVMTRSENPEYIERKMSALPGVYSVNVYKAKVKDQLQSLLGGDIKSFGANFLSKSYFSMKVLFEENISKNTRSLVREYLRRLVGNDGVSISRTKYPNLNKMNIVKNESIVKKWIDKVLFGFFSLIWVCTLLILSKHVKNQAFIIEQFQRKSNVSLKMYSYATLAIVFVSLAFAFSFNKNIEIVSAMSFLLIWILGASIFLKKGNSVKRYI